MKMFDRTKDVLNVKILELQRHEEFRIRHDAYCESHGLSRVVVNEYYELIARWAGFSTKLSDMDRLEEIELQYPALVNMPPREPIV
jgi:hypothetical protein